MKKLNQIKENNVRSLIARDRLCLGFVGRRGGAEHRFVSPFIKNYDDPEFLEEVSKSRLHDRNALRKENKSRKLNEKDYFLNFATRDLIVKTGFEQEDSLVNDIFNIDVEIEIDDTTYKELQRPPPIKNSLICNINLTARLLPSPTLLSA